MKKEEAKLEARRARLEAKLPAYIAYAMQSDFNVSTMHVPKRYRRDAISLQMVSRKLAEFSAKQRAA